MPWFLTINMYPEYNASDYAYKGTSHARGRSVLRHDIVPLRFASLVYNPWLLYLPAFPAFLSGPVFYLLGNQEIQEKDLESKLSLIIVSYTTIPARPVWETGTTYFSLRDLTLNSITSPTLRANNMHPVCFWPRK